MVVRDERKEEPREVVYCYEDGMKAFIEELNAEEEVLHEPVTFKGEYNGIKVEGCFQYTEDYQEKIYSFANMVRTRDGGTHETGARQAFTKTVNDYAKKNSNSKGFDGSDVREGLSLVINLTIPEEYLQFEGQTKDKLGSPLAKPATESIVSENLRYFLQENQGIADNLVKKITRAAAARQAARKAREDIRKGKGKQKAEKVLSGKLAPAQSKDSTHKELYLVEGDSAGGSAKQGRDSRYQAILPLRGKVLNTEKASMDAISKNVELNTIIHALGAGVGQDFSPEDSNYKKVIIMTDADDDGAHIQNLLLTFFYRHMRPLIDSGMLYIALPPLYRVAKGKEEIYVYDDSNLDEAKAQIGKGYTITRYKGLGEMNADQLWDTTMNPAKRTLLRVTVEDGRLADKRFHALMGDEADLRKQWLEENVEFEVVDDFEIEVK
jgi:topoisomerase-4 subunit B